MQSCGAAVAKDGYLAVTFTIGPLHSAYDTITFTDAAARTDGTNDGETAMNLESNGSRSHRRH